MIHVMLFTIIHVYYYYYYYYVWLICYLRRSCFRQMCQMQPQSFA
jgi:hypothetical protein